MDSFVLLYPVTMKKNRKFKELLVLGLEVGSLQNKKHVKPLHPHVNLKNRVISFGNGLNKWFHNYSMIKTVCNTEFTEINLSHRPHFPYSLHLRAERALDPHFFDINAVRSPPV